MSGLFFTGEGCGILVESGFLACNDGGEMGLCGFVNFVLLSADGTLLIGFVGEGFKESLGSLEGSASEVTKSLEWGDEGFGSCFRGLNSAVVFFFGGFLGASRFLLFLYGITIGSISFLSDTLESRNGFRLGGNILLGKCNEGVLSGLLSLLSAQGSFV